MQPSQPFPSILSFGIFTELDSITGSTCSKVVHIHCVTHMLSSRSPPRTLQGFQQMFDVFLCDVEFYYMGKMCILQALGLYRTSTEM